MNDSATCGGEHHPVMPRFTVTYYGAREYRVSTRQVPCITVAIWQGDTRTAGGVRRLMWYRHDMYDGRPLRDVHRG